MMPCFETQVECPALSDGNFPFVRTLDHCLVSIKKKKELIDDQIKKNLVRREYIWLIYSCVKHRSKDPITLQLQVVLHHILFFNDISSKKNG